AVYQAVLHEQIGPFPDGSAFATPVSVLACPSDNGIPSPAIVQDPNSGNYYAVTSYRPNVTGLPFFGQNWGSDGAVVNYGYNPVQITAITDGTSNTILFGEFSNFDPNWSPNWASLVGQPFSLAMNSAWTGAIDGMPAGSGYYPLNSSLPSSPPADFWTL